jgi:flagellar assembly protein FliH
MIKRLRLEAFGSDSFDPPQATQEPGPDVEEIRLKSYEQGYSAGWDDAVRAQADDHDRIREDLSRNLRELSFTFHEARTHMLRSLEPLLETMVQRVLPEIARETLGKSVVAELLSAAERGLETPIRLSVSAADGAQVEAAVAADVPFPLEIGVDPLLGDGQVHFRFGDSERILDTSAVVQAMQGLVAAFLDEPEQRLSRHG